MQLSKLRLVMAGVVAMFVMMMTVRERATEIGVLKAIGAARAVECLGLAGPPFERHRNTPWRLSGGEQQRVATAGAMAGPRLLLADEPTGNSDQATGQAVMELLRMLARVQGQTIVVATHNPDIARQADLMLRLQSGRLVGTAHDGWLLGSGRPTTSSTLVYAHMGSGAEFSDRCGFGSPRARTLPLRCV